MLKTSGGGHSRAGEVASQSHQCPNLLSLFHFATLRTSLLSSSKITLGLQNGCHESPHPRLRGRRREGRQGAGQQSQRPSQGAFPELLHGSYFLHSAGRKILTWALFSREEAGKSNFSAGTLLPPMKSRTRVRREEGILGRQTQRLPQSPTQFWAYSQ